MNETQKNNAICVWNTHVVVFVDYGAPPALCRVLEGLISDIPIIFNAWNIRAIYKA